MTFVFLSLLIRCSIHLVEVLFLFILAADISHLPYSTRACPRIKPRGKDVY